MGYFPELSYWKAANELLKIVLILFDSSFPHV